MTEKNINDLIAGGFNHRRALEILASARPAAIKACAENILDDLGEVAVLANRTGLAMLPYEDTVRGTTFHLGEVLVAEAHIQVPGRDVEGYGAVVGRDLEHAMGMAVIDAAMAADQSISPILELLIAESAHQERTDRERLRKVEATRVEMETF